MTSKSRDDACFSGLWSQLRCKTTTHDFYMTSPVQMINGDQENSNLKSGGSSLTLKCHFISIQFNSKVILDSFCNHDDSIFKLL